MGMRLVNPSWEVSWCVRPGVQERVTLRGHFYNKYGQRNTTSTSQSLLCTMSSRNRDVNSVC